MRRFLWTLVSAQLAGCVLWFDTDVATDGSGPDAGSDADLDADLDAGSDAGEDAAGSDAGRDATGDAERDGDDADGTADCDLNPCGGCTHLDEALGDPCGPCDLDQLVCDGTEALVCSGSTPCETDLPTNLQASDGAFEARVRLTFSGVADADLYRVYRNGVEIGTTATTSYDDTTAPAGGLPSAPVLTATTNRTDGVLLTFTEAVTTAGSPQTYAVTAVVGDTESDVSNTDTGYRGPRAVTGYEVAVGDGAFEALDADAALNRSVVITEAARVPNGTIAPGTIAATDGEATVALTAAGFAGQPGALVEFRVRGVVSGGTGAASEPASGRRGVGALSFAWRRSDTSSGTFSPIAGAATTASTFDPAPASDGTPRYYRALVTAPGADELLSGVDAGNLGLVPGAPTDLVATGDLAGITLSWTAATGVVDDYELSIDGAAFESLGSTTTNYRDNEAPTGSISGCSTFVASDGVRGDGVELSCTLGGVTEAAERRYAVRASNHIGVSEPTATATARRVLPSITYTWERSAGDAANNWSTAGTSSVPSYLDTGIAAGQFRYWRVRLTADPLPPDSPSIPPSPSDRGYRASPPTVTIPAPGAAAVLSGGVTLSANVTALNAASLSRVGWCGVASTTADPRDPSGDGTPCADDAVLNGEVTATAAGSYSRAFVDLTASTTYRVAAWAEGPGGTGWSSVISVVTDPGAADGAACGDGVACASNNCSGQDDPTRSRCAPAGWEYVPDGAFVMGSPPEEGLRDDDEAVHVVALTRPFFVSQTETTQAEWMEMSGGVNPANFASGTTERPVESIDWFAALAYANARSAADGLAPCYTLPPCADELSEWASGDTACTPLAPVAFAGLECPGYRLPTEAEWEYFARAGTSTELFGGRRDDLEDCSLQSALAPYAWYCANSADTTHAVATREPNPWGVYDTAGNVWEWCWDVYAPDFSWAVDACSGDPVTPTETTLDPCGPDEVGSRLLRGGSWNDYVTHARSANRNVDAPTTHTVYVGMRLVRTAQ